MTRLFDMLRLRDSMLNSAMMNKLNGSKRILDERKFAPQLKKPDYLVDKNRQTLNNLVSSMYNAFSQRMDNYSRSICEKAAALEMLSPLKVLSRGYSITMKDGKAITDSNELNVDDMITLKFSHGGANAVITVLEKGE